MYICVWNSKSSKGKKNGTKKGKGAKTLARRHSSVGMNTNGNGNGNGSNGGNGNTNGNGSGDEKDSKQPKAVGEAPKHRSLHSIRVMKRQQSQANSAALSGSTDGGNNALAAGVAAHAELMAANAVAAAAISGGSSAHGHGQHASGAAAKYVSASGAHTLPAGRSSSGPPPVIGDR